MSGGDAGGAVAGDDEQIAEVVAACAALGAAGLGDMVWGHPSVRDRQGRGVWMKASGHGFEEVDTERVVLVSGCSDQMVHTSVPMRATRNARASTASAARRITAAAARISC